MSFNIEWTNADALTPSPVTVIKDGCHFEFKLDAHYVSDEEIETLRRYIVTLNADNATLRELVRDMWRGCPVDERDCIDCDFERDGMCDLFDRMRELGVDA